MNEKPKEPVVPVSDEGADRTGATLSPVEIQKQQKEEGGEKNTPLSEDKKPEESEKKPEEKATDEKPKDSTEAPKPTEDKPKEKTEPLKTKPRSIYDEYKDRKKEVKEATQTIEELQSALSEKDKLITDLTEKAQKAETPSEKKEVEDEIQAIAEEIGADPAGIARLTEFLSKKLVKPDGVQISKEDLDAIQSFKKSQATSEAQAQFATEWNTFEPSLVKDFPHVSREDLASVRKEIDALAHTSQYHDKEIDYIYFKEREKLSKLISPKRQSFEGGDNKPAPQNDTPPELSGRSSPLDVMKATSNQGSSSLEIRPSQ